MNLTKDEKQQKQVYKDDKTQKELNTPLSDPNGIGADNRAFLELIIGLIDEGKIDLYKPETLINYEVYDQLREDKQGHADMEAVNLLATIRDIKGLYDAGLKDTYQMQNLVERLKNTKERLEEEGGNLFII